MAKQTDPRNRAAYEAYLSGGGNITKCPPAKAIGYKPNDLTAEQIRRERADWRAAQKRRAKAMED